MLFEQQYVNSVMLLCVSFIMSHDIICTSFKGCERTCLKGCGQFSVDYICEGHVDDFSLFG